MISILTTVHMDDRCDSPDIMRFHLPAMVNKSITVQVRIKVETAET